MATAASEATQTNHHARDRLCASTRRLREGQLQHHSLPSPLLIYILFLCSFLLKLIQPYLYISMYTSWNLFIVHLKLNHHPLSSSLFTFPCSILQSCEYYV
ncbi:hypothetical protein Pst134EA_026773 [Puccinia striiformis f. sp. tritici]|uniref:hypothetical protein n=1 Tax=Puccinia striiformis f. sp. tritici TaxID=168172 RepID=UPI002007378C|nr:hypothetical protein Pst134EA_026773 [Puccinia striiformis f. sp. tritici]KAH9442985.1 hypothetical protein Pst134EB_027335 [Puccinia striiformis f. sp. tritici]KAH9450061.1 hypothetical protein Pst134EA_026773 [Puccinia striiformis f. sp. tritici]